MCKMPFCLHGNSRLIDKFHPFVYNKSSPDVFLNERFAKEVPAVKMRICLVLILSLSLLMLPVQAAEAQPALSFVQENACEAGDTVTLTLRLPEITLAGGFVTLTYDPLLFSLTEISLAEDPDTLTLTYHNRDGKLNLLLDAAENVTVSDVLLSLTFETSEEIQPGTYPITCTVPDSASFYALNEDGSTTPLYVQGCSGQIEICAPALPTCPVRYLACQETNPAGGTITVRLCALAQDGASLSRGTYGFICSVTDDGGTRELTLGGSEMQSEIEGGGQIYSAEQFGGSGIYTATLQIAAQGEYRITLTPFVRSDGQTLYGGSYTVTYLDGVYIGTE